MHDLVDIDVELNHSHESNEWSSIRTPAPLYLLLKYQTFLFSIFQTDHSNNDYKE